MRNEPVETFTALSLRVEIYEDEDAHSPGEWESDNLFLVACNTPRHFHHVRNGFTSIEDVTAWRKTHRVFPLHVYIHGDVSLSLAATGQHGYVCVSKKEWKRAANARKAAEGLVEEWNTYLSGQVFGFRVLDAEGEELESCWGFYGSEHVKSEARAAAQSIADRETTRLDTETAMYERLVNE